MSGVGTYGAYGPVQAYEYAPGPAAWPGGLAFPLRLSGNLFASDLNQQLSAPMSFLVRKPMVAVCQQTVQAGIPISVVTPVTMDTEIADGWAVHSDGNDVSQLIIPPGLDGYWLVTGQCPVALPNGTGQVCLIHNGANVSLGSRQQANGSGVTPMTGDLIEAAAGDIIQLGVIHNASSTVSTVVGSPATPTGYLLSPVAGLEARWVAGTTLTLAAGGVAPATQQAIPSLAGGATLNVPATQLQPVAGITWADGQQAASATMTADIGGSVNFLANVPLFTAQEQISESVINDTGVQLLADLTASIDTWGAFNGLSGIFVAPIPGLYLCGGAVEFAVAGSSYFGSAHLCVTHSGVTQYYMGARAAGTQPAGFAMRMIRMAAGDTLALGAYQTSGTAQATVINGTRLFAAWVSQ